MTFLRAAPVRSFIAVPPGSCRSRRSTCRSSARVRPTPGRARARSPRGTPRCTRDRHTESTSFPVLHVAEVALDRAPALAPQPDAVRRVGLPLLDVRGEDVADVEHQVAEVVEVEVDLVAVDQVLDSLLHGALVCHCACTS